MLFHMSFSLSFELDQGLQHGYYELIDSIKKALSSFQPQKASIAKTLLSLGIFTLIHHPSYKGPHRQKPLLLLEMFIITHQPSHRGPQQQKTLLSLGYSLLSIILATEGLSSKKPSYSLLSIIIATKGSQQQKTLLLLEIFAIIYHSSHRRTSAAETPLTVGHIHLFSKREPHQKKNNNNNKIKNKK